MKNFLCLFRGGAHTGHQSRRRASSARPPCAGAQGLRLPPWAPCFRTGVTRPGFHGLSPGLIIVLVISSLSLFGPFFVRASPNQIDMTRRLLPPSAEHWFGTDTLGRDLLARVLAGGRISLGIGLSSAALSALLALFIGLYADGVLEFFLMGLCDALRAVPNLLLAIALMTALGGGAAHLIIVLALAATPVTARLVRSSALVVRSQPYIDAARLQGAGRLRILFLQILPNILSPLAAQMSFTCAQAMTVEAALSYLGAGIKPPLPSWGNILQEGQTVIFSAPWMIFFPGLFAALAILGINLLGDLSGNKRVK